MLFFHHKGSDNHEYVDLGLSVKWATCNIGAERPEEYGDYYAWGEVYPKANSICDSTTYAWYDTITESLTKYVTKETYGTVDNKIQLEKEDDIAHKLWGGKWRIPSTKEYNELRENCTWTWIEQNGVYGYKITSKKPKYSQRSIFLPATGVRADSTLYNDGHIGYYWSRELSPYYSDCAYYLYAFSDGRFVITGIRYDGLSIRPVHP